MNTGSGALNNDGSTSSGGISLDYVQLEEGGDKSAKSGKDAEMKKAPSKKADVSLEDALKNFGTGGSEGLEFLNVKRLNKPAGPAPKAEATKATTQPGTAPTLRKP